MNKQQIRRILVQRQGTRCFYCWRDVGPEKLTIDHKLPKSKGGGNKLKNLVLACRPCNRDKGSQTFEEYRKPMLDLITKIKKTA